MKHCKACRLPFETHMVGQVVCASCVLITIDEMACESVFHMTDEEIDQELREEGVDVEAFNKRVGGLVASLLASRSL